jgi:hypothetical protein
MAQRFDQRAAQNSRTKCRTNICWHCSAAANSLDWGTFQSLNPVLNLSGKNGRKSAASNGSPPMWVLLLLPFIGLLWVPFYNFQEPALFGFPFFYWYQLAWVPISSLLIWLVYRRRTPDEAP